MRKWILAVLAVTALVFLGGKFAGVTWAQDDAKVADATVVLFDFENELDLKNCEAKAGTETEISTEHATSGKQSLKVTLKGGQNFPGLYAERMSTKDWSGYATLKFDVFVDEPITLSMTVKDRKSKDYATRFNRDKIALDKGANTVTVELSDVADSIDLKTIKSVTLFSAKDEKDRTFYLDNVRLEK